MVLLRFLAVRLVTGFGPLALWNRLAGKLVEGLPREVLTCMADAYPIYLATADVHGSDAAVALHLEGGLVSFPDGAESRDEAGHGSTTGAGKGSEDGGVGMDSTFPPTFSVPSRPTPPSERGGTERVLTQNPLNSKRMTKQQLIEQVAAKTELKKSEAEVAVDSVLALIAEALRSNERVDLRGFGSFVVKERKERQGRNPRTGETITIAAKRDASFKPGKELTEKLAQAETAPTPEEAE